MPEPADEPLSDEAVYELLHDVRNKLSGRVVATPLGHDVLAVALRQIDILQMALRMMIDRDHEPTGTP